MPWFSLWWLELPSLSRIVWVFYLASVPAEQAPLLTLAGYPNQAVGVLAGGFGRVRRHHEVLIRMSVT